MHQVRVSKDARQHARKSLARLTDHQSVRSQPRDQYHSALTVRDQIVGGEIVKKSSLLRLFPNWMYPLALHEAHRQIAQSIPSTHASADGSPPYNDCRSGVVKDLTDSVMTMRLCGWDWRMLIAAFKRSEQAHPTAQIALVDPPWSSLYNGRASPWVMAFTLSRCRPVSIPMASCT
jgi:hypothetical protein